MHLWMYVCILYVCKYVGMCVYVCMHVCVCMYVCVYVCMYVCMCVYICIYSYLGMCVCMCVCMYVCVCVYIYMYTLVFRYVCMYVCCSWRCEMGMQLFSVSSRRRQIFASHIDENRHFPSIYVNSQKNWRTYTLSNKPESRIVMQTHEWTLMLASWVPTVTTKSPCSMRFSAMTDHSQNDDFIHYNVTRLQY